jgi:hypothetical protein
MTPLRPAWRAIALIWIVLVTGGYLHGIAHRLIGYLPH